MLEQKYEGPTGTVSQNNSNKGMQALQVTASQHTYVGPTGYRITDKRQNKGMQTLQVTV